MQTVLNPKAMATAAKKKAAASDFSSTRGSEERHSSVPVTGRGQKRGRDYEIEKVRNRISSPELPSSLLHIQGGRQNLPSDKPGRQRKSSPRKRIPHQKSSHHTRASGQPPSKKSKREHEKDLSDIDREFWNKEAGLLGMESPFPPLAPAIPGDHPHVENIASRFLIDLSHLKPPSFEQSLRFERENAFFNSSNSFPWSAMRSTIPTKKLDEYEAKLWPDNFQSPSSSPLSSAPSSPKDPDLAKDGRSGSNHSRRSNIQGGGIQEDLYEGESTTDEEATSEDTIPGAVHPAKEQDVLGEKGASQEEFSADEEIPPDQDASPADNLAPDADPDTVFPNLANVLPTAPGQSRRRGRSAGLWQADSEENKVPAKKRQKRTGSSDIEDPLFPRSVRAMTSRKEKQIGHGAHAPMPKPTSPLDPTLQLHPKLREAYMFDSQNGARVAFYQNVPYDKTLMIAGIPLDGTPVDLVPFVKEKRAQYKEVKFTNKVPFQEESFHSRPAVRIAVPDHLKALLVDDWENITKNLQLVPLPSEHPVNEILNTYFDEEKGKRRLGSAEADLLEEVVAGVKEYFEKCVGRILLYRFEREQYFEVRKLWEEGGTAEWDGKNAGDCYGAEHLCRLFGTYIHTHSPPPLPYIIPISCLSTIHLRKPLYTTNPLPRSLPPRTHRPNKHGPTIRQPLARRTRQADTVARQALDPLLHRRVRDCEPGLH